MSSKPSKNIPPNPPRSPRKSLMRREPAILPTAVAQPQNEETSLGLAEHGPAPVDITALGTHDHFSLLAEESTAVSEGGSRRTFGEFDGPQFVPTVRTCGSAKTLLLHGSDRTPTGRALDVLRSVAVVKKVFDSLGIPVILMGGLLRGWRRACTANLDDPDATLGTLGPWLAGIGIGGLRRSFEAHGHVLSSSMCPGGPLQAGCKIRVLLSGIRDQAALTMWGFPFVDIDILFSPPAAFSGGLPTKFSMCDRNHCGESCETCYLAYSFRRDSDAESDRFFPCPVPLRSFELAAWMNQTFWIPSNTDELLAAEYGREALPEALDANSLGSPSASSRTHGTCLPSLERNLTMSPYPSFVPSMPSMKKVMQDQAIAGKANAAQIHDSLKFEGNIPEDIILAASVAPGTGMAFLILIALNTLLLLSGCYIALKPTVESRGVFADWFGLRTMKRASLFIFYVLLFYSLMFLQRNAGKNMGYSPVSAVVWAYGVRSLIAVFVVWRSGRLNLHTLWEPVGGSLGRIPVAALSLVPGSCMTIFDVLSFRTLAEFDPLTYQVVIRSQLVLIVLFWQYAFRSRLTPLQLFSMFLLVLAGSIKGLDELDVTRLSATRGLLILLVQMVLSAVGNIGAELLMQHALTEQNATHPDLINALAYLQGMVVLLVASATLNRDPVVTLTELVGPVAWRLLFQEPWMIGSIFCLVAFGVVNSEFLKAFSVLQQSQGACFAIALSAVVEWLVFGTSNCTPLGLQACLMTCTAIGVYNVDPATHADKKPMREVVEKETPWVPPPRPAVWCQFVTRKK
eukprot:TRINITY_DN38135_c0_g1_i1.p1 TRINITY_DN38135_c0_g1~~TRINITY_DN38135_c0_g1_i1.p1  ORF type:complete len:883 (+),score=110.68 TRINITY_DN38135_c0_g1_i1:259-2649(+)